MQTYRLTRRGFVGASLAALTARPALAQAAELKATTRTIEVKGRAATVLGIDGPAGFGGLRLKRGERFRAELVNGLAEPTLVHWHGLTPPTDQDGVPQVSQDALAPGGRYSYDFENVRTGTHWMHSHAGLQEQSMLAAPLIVTDAQEPADEQEHVAMLHDFTFREPQEILAELKAGGGAHAEHDMSSMDATPAAAVVNDIAYDAYLANDRTLDDPEIVQVERGGRLRLRIINAAAASNLWIDLGVLRGSLIAADGNAVEPVEGSVFPLAVAQRADIRLAVPDEAGAWPVLFRAEGTAMRSGLILATPGAPVSRIAGEGEMAPALNLVFEMKLRAAKGLVPEPLSRIEMLMLTGGGSDYVWGLNGKASMHDTLFTVRPGERVGVMMHNMTSMAHPMHLHGHHFQVVEINGTKLNGAMRDTVLVPPNAAVTIAFDADNPGNWAFHCHHIYHMNAGMMGVVAYTSAA